MHTPGINPAGSGSKKAFTWKTRNQKWKENKTTCLNPSSDDDNTSVNAEAIAHTQHNTASCSKAKFSKSHQYKTKARVLIAVQFI